MALLPSGMVPEPITIYNKVGSVYKRTVVQGIWLSSTNRAIQSKGALPIDTISVYIFNFNGYVPQGERRNPSQWTIGVANSSEMTYIVRGNCSYHLTESRDSINKFLSEVDYKKPRAITDNRVGLRRFQHLVILC